MWQSVSIEVSEGVGFAGYSEASLLRHNHGDAGAAINHCLKWLPRYYEKRAHPIARQRAKDICGIVRSLRNKNRLRYNKTVFHTNPVIS